VLEFRRLQVPAGAAIAQARWPRRLGLAATLCGALWLAIAYPDWRERDLASISPIPAEMRSQDERLRREMGAPEVGFLLASRGLSETAALQAAGDILPVLQEWKQSGWIRSYDSPAWYLPAAAIQAGRLRSLPDTPTLQKNLDEALRGLAFRADAFAPFVRDVAAARAQAPLTRADYAATPLGAKLNALVVETEGAWLVLTPLAGVRDPGQLAAALQALSAGGQRDDTALVDLKQISTQMVDGFSQAALRQAAVGALAIVALLVFGLGSVKRSWRVAAPAAAALVLTAALLTAGGQRLSVFHLVALLLVLGIGLNYALFFERPPANAAERARTRLALAVCSLSTIATFGFLSLSATPVLHAIGSTVALGALVSLLLSALWARSSEA
jgi:predicted exporter